MTPRIEIPVFQYIEVEQKADDTLHEELKDVPGFVGTVSKEGKNYILLDEKADAAILNSALSALSVLVDG